jgi:hypothetical protein
MSCHLAGVPVAPRHSCRADPVRLPRSRTVHNGCTSAARPRGSGPRRSRVTSQRPRGDLAANRSVSRQARRAIRTPPPELPPTAGDRRPARLFARELQRRAQRRGPGTFRRMPSGTRIGSLSPQYSPPRRGISSPAHSTRDRRVRIPATPDSGPWTVRIGIRRSPQDDEGSQTTRVVVGAIPDNRLTGNVPCGIRIGRSRCATGHCLRRSGPVVRRRGRRARPHRPETGVRHPRHAGGQDGQLSGTRINLRCHRVSAAGRTDPPGNAAPRAHPALQAQERVCRCRARPGAGRPHERTLGATGSPVRVRRHVSRTPAVPVPNPLPALPTPR